MDSQTPYQPPAEPSPQPARSFTICPCHATAFVTLLIVALLVSLFFPTIELFKGRTSIGHVPLWYAYLGLVVPESWPIPFLIVAAHWIGSLAVAWLIDRILDVVLQPRE